MSGIANATELAKLLGSVIGLIRQIAKEDGPDKAIAELEKMTEIVRGISSGNVFSIDRALGAAEVEALAERLMAHVEIEEGERAVDEMLRKKFDEGE